MLKQVSDRFLVLYSSGSGVIGINAAIFGTWVLIFYNQVLGLSPVLASLALGIALVFDAISDPLIGAWSDRFNSRLGRRHPFIYASIIPLSLSFYFLFTEPASYSQSYLFWKLLILVLIIRISLTFYEIPRASLGPELTKDYDKRNFVNGWAYAAAVLGAMTVTFVMYSFFLVETEEFSGNRAFLNPEGYKYFGLFSAVLIILFGLTSALSTHRFIPYLHKAQDEAYFSLRVFLKELYECFSNKSWLVMLLAGGFYGLNIGITSGTATYVNTYFWEWTPSSISLFPVIAGIATIFGALLAVLITAGREKKNIVISVFILGLLIDPLPIWLRLLDDTFLLTLFPSNGTNLLWWVMIIHTSIVDALRAMGFVLVISMIYDIVEDSQISTGRRDEGVFMSGPNLIQKILSGFGIFILGIVMQIIGFDSNNMTTEEIQNPIKNLVIFQSVIGPVLSLAGIICLFFYNITRDKFDNTISDLGYKEN